MIEYKAQNSDYWLQYLDGAEPLAMPVDFSRHVNQEGQIGKFEFVIDEESTRLLKEYCKHQALDLPQHLLSGLFITLFKMTGQNDIIIGKLSDNEHAITTKNKNEFLTNDHEILVLREIISESSTVEEFSRQINQGLVSAERRGYITNNQLFELLQTDRDIIKRPLCQVLYRTIGFDGNTLNSEHSTEILNLLEIPEPKTNLPFELLIEFFNAEDLIKVNITYARILFREKSIARFNSIYVSVLKYLISNNTRRIDDIHLLSRKAERVLTQDWNKTDVSYPENNTLQEIFEQQVAKKSDSLALAFAGREDVQTYLTYGGLNFKANQLANAIVKLYFRQYSQALPGNTLIAIYFDKGPKMLISLLAVLKAGCAFVPLSTDLPENRTQYILQDTQAKILLTEDAYVEKVDRLKNDISSQISTMSVDEVLIGAESTAKKTSRKYQESSFNKASDLAYVIYTSGTTGVPKGVLVDHKAVCSFAINNRYIDSSLVRNVVSLSPYSFDGFIFDAFYTLLNGACVHLINRELILDSYQLCDYLAKNNIDSCFITTALFNQLITSGQLAKTNLKQLLFGGEKANLAIVMTAVNQLQKTSITHVYGPTETVVFASAYRFGQQVESVPIGKPLNNKRFYVLDPKMKPVPIGIPGELYIGGAGLSKGYLNQTQLTDLHFVNNPFASDVDIQKGYTRIYKTGDIVRWLDDGNLEFIGRRDRQVKVRGYRIELAEIEFVLARCPNIKQATVIMQEHQSNPLISAYLVTHSEMDFSLDQLRDTLSARLPEYMIPDAFTLVKSIPLTLNGKIDYRALPVAEFVRSNPYVAPKNEVQGAMCDIWQHLLGIQNIGIRDNFFRLGGSSITAVKLSSLCRRELGVDLPLATLFKYKTIQNISNNLSQKAEQIISRESETRYLSFAQERMLFIDRFEKGTDAYHIPRVYKLLKDVQLPDIEKVINQIIERHRILKTVYRNSLEEGDFLHLLDAQFKMNVYSIDDNELNDSIQEEITRHFDLANEHVIRATIFRTDDDCYLLFVWHHIAFDGWSLDLFMKEFEAFYRALKQVDSMSKLDELPIDYFDYTIWQKRHLKDRRLNELSSYWLDLLGDFQPLNLPTDHTRPQIFNYLGKNFTFILDKTLSLRLKMMARVQETSLYSVLLSGFYITLSVLSGQSDIVLGTPSDNRQRVQTQALIGLFVNSLVLRIKSDFSITCAELIQQVHRIVTNALIHQDMPFEKLVEMLNVERDPSRHPVFQVMFSLQNFDEIETYPSLPFKSLASNCQLISHCPALFDLCLFMKESQDMIEGELNYAIELFDSDWVERFASIYQRVMLAIVSDDNQPISQLGFLSRKEADKLCYQWSHSVIHQLSCTSVIHLVEQAVAKSPNSIAVELLAQDGLNHKITYLELNEKANQLARYIRDLYYKNSGKTLVKDSLIALYLDRSISAVIGILAVLKADAAYVPISTENPKSRTSFILSDTQSKMILTETHLANQLREDCNGILDDEYILPIDDHRSFTKIKSENLNLDIQPTDLAYVIYTSGTSGDPKGVMVEHHSVANLIASQTRRSGFNNTDKVLWLAEYIFDASVEQLFMTITNGATLYVPSRTSLLNFEFIRKVIVQLGITHLDATPSYYSMLGKIEDQSRIRRVICGGERSIGELKQLWGNLLINAYGPTETTVTATECVNYSQHEKNDCIGKPIDNTLVYVLSNQQKLIPIGVPGELYIGGEGVARGYLNRPELTKEMFVTASFVEQKDNMDSKSNVKMYKTGDIVRWLPDGNLEYLGRKDKQIKIRGFRVELSEIENQLLRLDFVTAAVVLVRKDHSNTQRLVAYIVSDKVISPHDIDKRLRDHLQAILPDYMIPAIFTGLKELPLTVNGKLNVNALPEPQLIDFSEYIALRTETEAILANIWQDLLKIDLPLSVNANFFKLGGHSLLATKMKTLINTQFSVDVELKDMFVAMTLEKISQLIDVKISNKEWSHQQRVNVFHNDSEYEMEEFEL